jgi:hypothetical protein
MLGICHLIRKRRTTLQAVASELLWTGLLVPSKDKKGEQRTANSKQRTANSEQRKTESE